MSIFKNVDFLYRDKKYTVRANEIMPLLAQVEDVITLSDLSNKNRVPLVRISQAYGVVLRYAGANVSDEEVYADVFTKGGAAAVSAAISGLLTLMIPPTKLQESISTPSASDAKKPKAKRKS